MKAKELKEILHVLEEATLEQFSITKGDFSLSYRKKATAEKGETKEDRQEEATPFVESIAEQTTTTPEVETEQTEHQIVAPMVGTFYSRPNPETAPFVQIGDHITKEQPVCILEAMKLLNEIFAEVDGEITAIHAKEGDIVSYGEPLFTVRKA